MEPINLDRIRDFYRMEVNARWGHINPNMVNLLYSLEEAFIMEVENREPESEGDIRKRIGPDIDWALGMYEPVQR